MREPADATTSLRGILDPAAARRHFRLTRYAPCAALAHLVERYWVVAWDLRGRPPFTQSVVSHPSVNLVVEPSQALVFGVNTGRFDRELRGRGGAVAVKFRPAGFHPFMPVPAATLTNRAIPLAQAFGASDLHERVLAAGERDAPRIALLEAFLLERLPPRDPQVERVHEIVRLILAEGDLTRVEQLVARLGTTPRTLQRLFREYVGVSPKWVLRRVRLHEAAERMGADPDVDWPLLALELGYFDQAHFIRDFKSVVGRSPADYAAVCRDLACAA